MSIREWHAACENNDDLWAAITHLYVSLFRNLYVFPITGCDNYMVYGMIKLTFDRNIKVKNSTRLVEKSNKTNLISYSV